MAILCPNCGINTYIWDHNMTHEKKKMTRAEAVKLFEKYHIYGDANDTVQFYIEAGMLEIVEESKLLICDHIDSRPMIIKRHGKIIYDETKIGIDLND